MNASRKPLMLAPGRWCASRARCTAVCRAPPTAWSGIFRSRIRVWANLDPTERESVQYIYNRSVSEQPAPASAGEEGAKPCARPADFARRAADEIRPCHQSEDCKGAWCPADVATGDRAAQATTASTVGDRKSDGHNRGIDNVSCVGALDLSAPTRLGGRAQSPCCCIWDTRALSSMRPARSSAPGHSAIPCIRVENTPSIVLRATHSDGKVPSQTVASRKPGTGESSRRSTPTKRTRSDKSGGSANLTSA